jgi:hypothetical protein
MASQNDCLVALEQNNTIIAVIEMSLNNWLVAGIVPHYWWKNGQRDTTS